MRKIPLTPSEDTEFLDNIIMEEYEGEAKELFLAADTMAGEEVQEITCIDSLTEEDLILERDDWI